MDPAPLAAALNAMLAGLLFAIAVELDPSAVHEQVEWAVGTAIWELDTQGFLPAAQRAEIGNGPVKSG